MRKQNLILSLIFIPSLAFGSINKPVFDNSINLDKIPVQFMSSGETDTIEWGCPVTETISASSSTDALLKIGQACMDDVKREANNKPGVFEVIRVSVIWPDLQISETHGGFYLEGTVFIETVVMKEGLGGR